eukprot:2549582-Prymnesium_polylepis.1
MPTTVYKDPRTCACGYSTINPSNWSQHKKRCKLVVTSEKDVIATLKQQLATKDEQLAAKDEQIKELIQVAKKPRT